MEMKKTTNTNATEVPRLFFLLQNFLSLYLLFLLLSSSRGVEDSARGGDEQGEDCDKADNKEEEKKKTKKKFLSYKPRQEEEQEYESYTVQGVLLLLLSGDLSDWRLLLYLAYLALTSPLYLSWLSSNSQECMRGGWMDLEEEKTMKKNKKKTGERSSLDLRLKKEEEEEDN